jgi:hypothetical protein
MQRCVGSLIVGLEATVTELRERYPTTQQGTALSMVDSNWWLLGRGLSNTTGQFMPELDRLLCKVCEWGGKLRVRLACLTILCFRRSTQSMWEASLASRATSQAG